jgi:hypothetical protein
MNNEIAVYDKCSDMSSIQILGESIASSGMFGCENKAQGIVIAMQCMTERKPPLEMAKTYHLVKGKLAKRADAMLAEFRKAGGKWTWGDLKDRERQTARVEFEGDVREVEYSINDAMLAGVYNQKSDSPWQKNPAAMCRARLTSETLRAIAPEIVQGAYTPEEISQFDKPPHREPDMSRAEPVKVADPKKYGRYYTPIAIVEKIALTDKEIDAESLDGDDPTVDLESKLEPHKEAVEQFMESKGYIQFGQTWRDAPKDVLSSIHARTASFLKAAGVE